MEVLLARLENEGRTRTVEVLRQALERLDAREEEARTLEEWMAESTDSLESGLVLQAVEQQARAVEELERLLSVLLDRANREDLDEKLRNVAELRARVGELASEERRLEQEIEELRASSKSTQQVDLETGISETVEAQRELSEETQAAGRESRDYELAWLAAELERLERNQGVDAELAERLRPTDMDVLDATAEELRSARRDELRAERSRATARALEQAAEDLENGLDPLEALEEALRSARDAAELSPDEQLAETARASTETLEEALESARSAGDASERSATAEALRENAREQRIDAARDQARAGEQRERTAQRLETEIDADGAAQPARDEALEALAQALERARAAAEPENAESPSADPLLAQGKAAAERAQRALERGRADLARLGSELARSQGEQAASSDQMERALETLTEDATEPGPREALAEARQAVSEAARAQRSAEQALRGADESAAPDPEAGASQARDAERALGRAREALDRAREQSAGDPATSERNAGLSARQSELEGRMEQLGEQASTSPNLSAEDAETLEQQLDRAREASEQARSELDAGRPSDAARSQDRAIEELGNALRTARDASQLSTPEARERAAELAERQEQIEEDILRLAELAEELEEVGRMESLERARESAAETSRALRQGQGEQAEESAEETRRELEEAERALAEEEQRYLQLRQEEVLFEIAEETQAVLDTHLLQMAATRDLDARLEPGERPGRAVRLGLRRVAREEAALAERTGSLEQALEEEGSVVFAEGFRSVRSDLERIAESMDETGDYQSGERVQALQRDVEDELRVLLEALEQEQQRRERERSEQQQDQQGDQQQPPDGQNRLVPDQAELKLLKRMELDLQASLSELELLYPELTDGGEVDPLVFEDIRRLAAKHDRLTKLFGAFRERLGLPDPDAGPGETPQEETR